MENDKCDPSRNFETLKNCTGEQEECDGEWFSGPWGEVSTNLYYANIFTNQHDALILQKCVLYGTYG